MREYITASQTRSKYHMRFGTLLFIILRLAMYLSLFIIPSALFCQGEHGSVVLPSIGQRSIHSCSSVCGPVCYPVLSDIRVLGTPIPLVATLKDSPACDLDRMG